MTLIQADAQPEKRLFISLLTRDISLAAAFLDLIDNSINAAMLEYADKLRSASDYHSLADRGTRALKHVSIIVSPEKVTISDDAGGISAKVAAEEVFKFGRDINEDEETSAPDDDRLSVYGIGLKRAIFKMGNQIKIRSDHPSGGFDLDLHVPTWQRTPQAKWEIPISTREPADQESCGTTVTITDLRPDVKKRISDITFEDDLRDKISETYSYFIDSFVTISLNGTPISGASLDFDGNISSDSGDLYGVSFTISAGLARPNDLGRFSAENSGWFIFCNGRNVIYADKSTLTGWGVDGFLPQFQPKHRPFLGLVFFVSDDPEALPWTTTKSSINQESALWQDAKRRMASVGRGVITYLDRRYTDDGVERSLAEIAATQTERVSMLEVATATQRREFAAPARKPATDVTIQYRAKISEIDKIRAYRGDKTLSAREVGRQTFDYYLSNVVDE